MNHLSWLVGHRLVSFARRECDWLVCFDNDASLVVCCLWRVIESGRICRTASDDGEQFGLPASVDAAADVGRWLKAAVVHAVELREGTLDLELRFSSGHVLQIIPDSSGFEAWSVDFGSRQFIAVGGGQLAIVDSNQKRA